MTALDALLRRWEVRPTLRLTHPPDQEAVERVADLLRQHPRIAVLHVGRESSVHSEGIIGTIVLTHPSTPGAAVDEVTRRLAEACAAAGLATDVIKEIVVEMADVDPRSL